MHRYLAGFFFSLLLFAVTAQDTISSYWDVNGSPTDFFHAIYFQKKGPSTAIDLASHQASPLLYVMSNAEVADPSDIFPNYTLASKMGRFIFLNAKGGVAADAVFVQDQREGHCYTYFDNGQISDDEWYLHGKRDSISRYYHPNGKIASIEQYAADSLIAFTLFHADGSSDTVHPAPGSDPQFPGGVIAMRQFLAAEIRYPEAQLEYGITGKCYLQFVVGTDGRISGVTVLRGIRDCPECDKEAKRVIKTMPSWNPCRQHNRPVETTLMLPIGFFLN